VWWLWQPPSSTQASLLSRRKPLDLATPTTDTFRAWLLGAMASLPRDGGYRFEPSERAPLSPTNPRDPHHDGVTADLDYNGRRVAISAGDGTTYCCGVTYEAVHRAFMGWAKANDQPPRFPGLDEQDVLDLITQWFCPVMGHPGAAEAIEKSGLGTRVAAAEAEPGDLCQFWRRTALDNPSGHSVVFLGFEDEGRTLRYWSSQRSTNGIGVHRESIGEGWELHFARIGRPVRRSNAAYRRTLEKVTVYCASSNRLAPHFFREAHQLGAWLAAHGTTVVYGGGSVGLMAAVADAALALGGEVIGVIPEKLLELELAHHGVTRLDVVPDMQTRKRRMAELGDAFIALPGGYGTLEELFEVTTWTQLNDHLKPVCVLDQSGYYAPLFTFLEGAAREGFVRPLHAALIGRAATPAEAVHHLRTARIPLLDEWISRARTDGPIGGA
jgi:uncharacterized protein (TIGR00730 family)